MMSFFIAKFNSGFGGIFVGIISAFAEKLNNVDTNKAKMIVADDVFIIIKFKFVIVVVFSFKFLVLSFKF